MELDTRAIEAILPHRAPFLMIDHVELVEPDRIVARKTVTADEPFFQGHFPGCPIMPGVLIIEALAQAGAVLGAQRSSFDPARQIMVFMAIEKAKFRKPVLPGDVLKLEVVPLRMGTAVWKMRGEAKVGGVVVAEAEFLAGIRPRSDVAP
ncbi:MAG TPA: 3-hydroxyacyl-ACP dehydratase FabZ [Polyangia bacterium]|nr:3-hydroxyacyl-ACP dehydratase FabZ [Polyangia bacterium]